MAFKIMRLPSIDNFVKCTLFSNVSKRVSRQTESNKIDILNQISNDMCFLINGL